MMVYIEHVPSLSLLFFFSDNDKERDILYENFFSI